MSDRVHYSASEIGALPLPQTTALHELTLIGVAHDLLGARCHAVERLFLVRPPEHHPLVAFARSGISERICLDPITSTVVCVLDLPHARPAFVNSSLRHYNETVQAVATQLSRDLHGGAEGATDLAAKNVADIVLAIDPPAMAPDLFWSTLVDDVAIGDFAL